MKNPLAAGLRAAAAPIALSTLLLAACQTAPTFKPPAEQTPAYRLVHVNVLDFKRLEPGQVLFCPPSGRCNLGDEGQDLGRLIFENPRRVFLTCLADAKITCERVATANGIDWCAVPKAGPDLETLTREAARKCIGLVNAP